MKGRLAKRRGVKRKYDTAADSVDTRNTVGAIYAAMKRLVYERHACDAVLSEAGFQYQSAPCGATCSILRPIFPLSYRQARRVASASCRPTRSDFLPASFWPKMIVDLSSVLGFLEDHLDVQLSRSTVHNVLHKLGHSSPSCRPPAAATSSTRTK